MGPSIIIPVSFFLIIFGITYLHYSTRNKERMALIEKGADASIFVSGKRSRNIPTWKILIPNLALLLAGIGLAVFIASIFVNNMGMDEEVAYPGTIFLMAGVGLFTGFTLTKKMDKEAQS